MSRLPTHYRSAGVRVYNPLKPQWKLQLAWALQLSLCAFLVLFFFSTLSTYWEHISKGGVDEFVYAYLVETLVIQAFACEFRELFSAIIWNLLVREFLMLVFCLRCRKDTLGSSTELPPEAKEALTRLGAARARHGMARGAVSGGRRLTHIASLTNLRDFVRAPEPEPEPEPEP